MPSATEFLDTPVEQKKSAADFLDAAPSTAETPPRGFSAIGLGSSEFAMPGQMEEGFDPIEAAKSQTSAESFAPIPTIPPDSGLANPIEAAVANTVIGGINFATSPAGMSTLPVAVANPVLGRLVGALFAPEMISGGIKEAIHEPTIQGKLQGVLQAIMGVGGAAHATGLQDKLIPKKGVTDASEIPSATRATQPEIRPQVGEETPLRQQGEAPQAQAGPETVEPLPASTEPAVAATAPPESAAAAAETLDTGRNQNLPEWAREEMIRRGLEPGRTFNDVDLSNPSVREAIQLDPTLTDAQKESILKSGAVEQNALPTTHVIGPVLLDKNGEVIAQGGEIGQTHADLMRKAIGTPDEPAALESFAADNGRGFLIGDSEGGTRIERNRKAAGDIADEARQRPEQYKGADLHSEHLAEGKEAARAAELASYQEQLNAAHESLQRTGDELVAAVKKLGGIDDPSLAGELRDIKETMLGTSKLPKRTTKSGELDQRHGATKEINEILRKGGETADRIVQGLQEQGFNIKTPGQLVTMLRDRFLTGKQVYGGMSPEVFGFGPGAAAEGEFGQMGRKPARIANADIDKERAVRGAEPLMSEARKANPVLWDETMAQLDRTPQLGQILVDNINAGEIKATSNVQQTILLHEELRLRNEKAMEADRAVDPHASEEERADARSKFIALEARIDATERAARKAGSIAGSALQARQIAAYDDFTYAAIETRARNAKGAPLTLEESTKIKAQADEIASLKAELAKAADQGARDQAMEALQNLIRENAKSAKAEFKAGRSVRDILHDQADAARQRIIDRRGRLQVTVDPLNVAGLVDEAIIGASHIADGISNFADWSKAMLKDFGERIQPYLDQLFERSQEYHDSHAKLAAKTRPKQTPIEKVAEAAKAAKAGAEQGGELTNRMVFDLAREHVRAGVTDLDKVMQAVAVDLQPHFPGLTEREVRDMFSDYGKVRFPSKAQDLAALRDLRRQGQLVSALEDAERGLSPKKTGLQRDVPSEKVKTLQKQVQDAMRESGITGATDPSRLKTNLDRYKTALDNRIQEAQRRLSENDYAKPTRRSTVLDKEAEAKKATLGDLQLRIDREIEKLRLQNRTPFEKFQDAAVKWARIAKLASPKIFPKLAEAGLIRVVTNPITRVLGQPLRLIPGLTEKAPAQLRMGLKAEATRVGAILSSGPEAFRKLIGKSKLDALGKKKLLDNEMLNFVGNAHGAMKEPVRQGEYKAATIYYTQQALASGLDIREPAVQAHIISSSVADANWQIFMGDNPFSKYFVSMVVQGLKNGKFVGAKTLANAVQFVMPIVKVSSNIAIHTSRLGIGIPEALTRLGVAAKRGELGIGGTLSREDAQAITRSFSTGALGLILAAYAWENPQHFGGVYAENVPKNKKLKTNEIEVLGHVVPGWMNHAPEMQWLSTVASARRVYDKYYSTGKANAGFEAMAFALMSPVKNLPFIDSWLRLFAGRQSAGQTVGQTARDAIFPGGKSVLGLFDKKERAPKTGLQEIEMAIPGLRQTVPTRK